MGQGYFFVDYVCNIWCDILVRVVWMGICSALRYSVTAYAGPLSFLSRAGFFLISVFYFVFRASCINLHFPWTDLTVSPASSGHGRHGSMCYGYEDNGLGKRSSVVSATLLGHDSFSRARTRNSNLYYYFFALRHLFAVSQSIYPQPSVSLS